jgi:hypothetical protein
MSSHGPQDHRNLARTSAGVVGAEQSRQASVLQMAPRGGIQRVWQRSVADARLEGPRTDLVRKAAQISQIVCAVCEDAPAEDAHRCSPLFARALIGVVRSSRERSSV